nr:6109_t:CDS:2 [Entrophospora candida]
MGQMLKNKKKIEKQLKKNQIVIHYFINSENREKSQHNNKENIEEVKDNESWKNKLERLESKSFLTDEVVHQTKEIHEKVVAKKIEIIPLSSFNTTNWQAFLSKLTSKWIVNDSLDETADIEKYVWSDYPESHETQRKNYMSYLKRHVNLLPQISILDVTTNKMLLQLYNDSRLPFNLSGGTDVILFENTAEIPPQTGIRSVIELKKQVQPVNVYQATIIAYIITPNHISAIGVLTDLKDNWLNEKEVIGTKFTQRKSAIKFIESMILEEEWATKKKGIYLSLINDNKKDEI